MASVSLAKNFWKTVKSVSVKAIAEEAHKPFALAIVGPPDAREEGLKALFPGAAEGDVVPERSLIRAFDSTSPADGFPADAGAFDFIIDAGGGRIEAPEGARIFSVIELGGWDRVKLRMLEERPDLVLSLARRLPGLREEAAEQIIRETSITNAEFAMISALPGAIPIIGPLLPAASIGDIFMLTKNQVMMMYRLAAIYDLPLDVSSRSRDIAPILAQAFGWRTLAREIVGVVPGGVGMAARGTIAYAGTVAVGKAVHLLYRTGIQPSRRQIGAFYRQAIESGRQTARSIAARLRPRRALPPASEPDAVERKAQS